LGAGGAEKKDGFLSEQENGGDQREKTFQKRGRTCL